MVTIKYNKIIITGVAGFIGFYLAKRLLEEGWCVIGGDNLNTYYDVNLKKARIAILGNFEQFKFIKLDISKIKQLEDIFEKNDIDVVVNLAAQAGVRYSIENPHAYVESNLVGFVNILECCRRNIL
ncbi:MAG: SDR family NAD(P)-dependent oxidoreductase [Desulfamplus sp.]|nr:SDR family NAD(P)-dependent oxidoreductase [Desulfamplus sp.]